MHKNKTTVGIQSAVVSFTSMWMPPLVGAPEVCAFLWTTTKCPLIRWRSSISVASTIRRDSPARLGVWPTAIVCDLGEEGRFNDPERNWNIRA